MENFREILQELILASGLSLRKLSQASGVTTAQYSRYLNGGKPTIPVAIKIANYFGCSLDYLCGLTDKKQKAKNPVQTYHATTFVNNYQKLLADHHLTNYLFAKQTQLFDESIVRHWRAGCMPRLEVVYCIAKNLYGSIDELLGQN